MPVTLVAADPHPIFLLGLEHLFSTEMEMTLLAACHNAAEALQEVQRQQPDILLLDINLPDKNGMELISELKHSSLKVKIVILTHFLNEEQTIDALRMGVKGVVLKDMPKHLLVQCLQKVATGGVWMEKESIGQAFEKMLRREAGMRRLATILTPRETEVMSMVAQGLSNRQIAEGLLVTEGTIKIHIHNIYGKLGINNRVDLTLYAQKKGVA